MAFKLVILSCLLAFASARNVQELIVENYVIGGHETKPGEFPHQVSLQWGFDRVTAEHFCGGSIIHRQWILTAAHCIESIPFYGTVFIRAGKHNLTKFEKEEFDADIYDAYVHPLFIGGAAPFDIALIKLRAPLKLTKRINIAKLPKRFEETTGLKVLAGWGAKDTSATSPRISDVLQKVSLPIMDIKACNETIIKLTHPDTSPLHWTNLCTAPVETGDGACMSDAGSALIDPRDDGDKIVGLVSWGFVPCGSNKSPSIFVKVSDFVDWINETIISNS